jgi:hypothetical protein
MGSIEGYPAEAGNSSEGAGKSACPKAG